MNDATALQEESAVRLRYSRRHLRFGWWSLFAFTALGMGLDLLHGFKAQTYLDASNQTRRLMWTLAHAHGTLIAVVNVIFGICLRVIPGFSRRSLRLISWILIASGIVLPLSFFLGGIAFYGGDPGLGGLLVPLGATLLLIALFLIARGASYLDLPEDPQPSKPVRPQKKGSGTEATKR
jgi:hypothetical protein